jgi:hypothetical protein
MLKSRIDEGANVNTIETVVRRHQNRQGFCQCCDQPWPCDVRVISGLILVGEE